MAISEEASKKTSGQAIVPAVVWSVLPNRRALTVVLDQAFRSLTTFATGLLVARFCSVKEHGYFVLATTLLLMVANIQETILTSPYMFFFPRRRNRASARYQAAVVVLQGFLGVLAFTGLGLIGLVGRWGDYEWGNLLLVLAPVAAALLLRDFVRETFMAKRQPEMALLQDVPLAILQIGVLWLVAAGGDLDSNAALLITAAVAALVSIPMSFGIGRAYARPTWKYVCTAGAAHLSFGRWLALARITYWISLASYPLILAMVSGPEESSLYGACQRVPTLFIPALAALMSFLLPKLSHDSARDGQRTIFPAIRRATLWVGVVSGVLSALLILFANRILWILYGEQYAGNADLVILQTLGFFAHGITFCLALGFYALKKPWVDCIAYGAATALTLPIGVWACFHWGSIGASVAYLLGGSIVSIVRFVVYARIQRNASPGQEFS
jgi:O-antigen/teichoic acid export membrane protein